MRQRMVPPCMVRNSTLREKDRSVRRPNSATAGETQRDRKSTASAEAKIIFHAVKGSSNAYPPLKSIAEGLWLILGSCGV